MLIPNSTRKLVELHAADTKQNPASLEDHLYFLIDTNYITYVDRGHDDPICREKLIEYFQRKDRWIEISQVVYEMYPEERGKGLTNQEAYNIIQIDPAWTFTRTRYHFNTTQGVCLDLCEAITLNRGNYIDRDFFDFFFAYRLSKRELERVSDFIAYAFQVHFENNIREFTLMLTTVLLVKYKSLLSADHIRILDTLLGNSEPAISTVTENKDDIPASIGESNLTVRQLALMYHYLQEANEYPIFGTNGKYKKDEILEISKNYNVSKNTFTQHYNSIHSTPTERTKNLEDLQKVLTFLPPDSKAKALVENAVKQINPLN